MTTLPNRTPRIAVPATIGGMGPGLDEQVVHRALLAGQEAARRTRPAHPRNFAGLTATAEATAVLRELLLAAGWTSYYNDGINGALSPDGAVMLMFVPGDRYTGDITSVRPPRSKRRGPKGLSLVQKNQLELFPNLTTPRNDNAMTTWYILNRYDRDEGRIYVEVSLPDQTDADDRVCGWAQRFCLAPVIVPPLDPALPPVEFDAGERIDVEVEPIDEVLDGDPDPTAA